MREKVDEIRQRILKAPLLNVEVVDHLQEVPQPIDI